MPTIEFFGYSHKDSELFIEKAKPLLAKFTFCEHIVFVLTPDDQRKVIGWDGNEYPFIRISSRSEDRLALLREQLNDKTDIETVAIGFYPKLENKG